VKLRLDTSDPARRVEMGLQPGDSVFVETARGKGVTVTVKGDGTLRIEVNVSPDSAPCLAVVPDIEPAS
jgi:hypothetical protein